MRCGSLISIESPRRAGAPPDRAVAAAGALVSAISVRKTPAERIWPRAARGLSALTVPRVAFPA